MRSLTLPGRGPGAMAVLEFGPADRPVDIVFLHATGFNALTYRQILQPLGDTLRVVAVDQRGHGATTLDATVDGRRDWGACTADLLAVLEVLNIESAVLSGHSMGASVALLAAPQASSRVRSLVLFDPVIMPVAIRSQAGDSPIQRGAARRRANFPSRAAAFAAYHARGAFTTWPDAILHDYVTAGFRDLPDGEVTLACAPAWEAWVFSAQDNDVAGAFATSQCPIRILKAEHRSTFGSDAATAEALRDPRISLEVVPGSSHFLPMERPDLVRDALRQAVA